MEIDDLGILISQHIPVYLPHLPLRNNTPQGIFLSLYEWKRQAFPYCRAIRVDGGADGGNVVGIHGPGDGSVLGIDVADRDELRLDGPEDRHDFAALQRAAGDVKADLGRHAAAVHHAVQGAAGVRRFDIEAGPFDAVLGEVIQQADAVDGESVRCDKASHSIGQNSVLSTNFFKSGVVSARFFVYNNYTLLGRTQK